MRGFRRSQAPESDRLARARRRVEKMGASELLEWAEVAISGMGRGFLDYRKEEEVVSLLEIRDEALPALTALVDELIMRNEAARS